MAETASVSNDGRLSIVGTFDRIELTRLPDAPVGAVGPAKWPNCCLVAVLEWSQATDGQRFALALRFLGADGEPVRPDAPGPTWDVLPSASGRPMRRPLVAPLLGLVFPAVGEYTIQLLVNGSVVAELEVYADEASA
jgi:hypothetical protein